MDTPLLIGDYLYSFYSRNLVTVISTSVHTYPRTCTHKPTNMYANTLTHVWAKCEDRAISREKPPALRADSLFQKTLHMNEYICKGSKAFVHNSKEQMFNKSFVLGVKTSMCKC